MSDQLNDEEMAVFDKLVSSLDTKKDEAAGAGAKYANFLQLARLLVHSHKSF